jgi:hypothetical protein
VALLHKLLTYVEYRALSGVFQNIDPSGPTPFPPSECVLPPHQRRTHSPGGERGGGSIFWKKPDIGLASYSIIALRIAHIFHVSDSTVVGSPSLLSKGVFSGVKTVNFLSLSSRQKVPDLTLDDVS